MKRRTALLLALAMLILTACGTRSKEWKEQYDLGTKYLSDGNYQEAILAFSAAIEIEPKAADAYVGRADAYVDAAVKLAEGGITPGTGQSQQVLRCLQCAEADYETALRLAEEGGGLSESAETVAQKLAETTERREQVEAHENAAANGQSAEQKVALPEDEAEPLSFEELVTDAYARDCTYIAKMYREETGTSEATEITCSYRIPQIHLPGSEIEQINAEAYDTLYPVIEDAESEIAEYGYPFTSDGISYYGAVNGDILSLVILNESLPDYGGGSQYLVYNVSISTGTVVPDETVTGMPEAEFLEFAKQVLGSCYWEGWELSNENFSYQSFVDLFNRQLEKTISEENIRQSHCYRNEKGQLCIVARIYSLADADYYWHDLNMDEFELSPFYGQQAERITHPILISEDEAHEIASDYWGYYEGAVDQETGFALYLVYDGMQEKTDGNHYYAFRLRWWVAENNMMSTVDYVYVNAETGECSYSI